MCAQDERIPRCSACVCVYTWFCIRTILSIPKPDLYPATRNCRHARCLLLLRENSRKSDGLIAKKRVGERERQREKEKKPHIRTQGMMKRTRVAYHARGSTPILRHEPRSIHCESTASQPSTRKHTNERSARPVVLRVLPD